MQTSRLCKPLGPPACPCRLAYCLLLALHRHQVSWRILSPSHAYAWPGLCVCASRHAFWKYLLCTLTQPLNVAQRNRRGCVHTVIYSQWQSSLLSDSMLHNGSNTSTAFLHLLLIPRYREKARLGSCVRAISIRFETPWCRSFAAGRSLCLILLWK